MCTLRENKILLGGCSSRIPWIRSSVLTMRRSYWPSPPRATSQSSVDSRRCATFHSKPSWSLKNSRKAGSEPRSGRPFRGGEEEDSGDFVGEEEVGWCCFLGLLLGPERQICARRPSTCFRPFLILALS